MATKLDPSLKIVVRMEHATKWNVIAVDKDNEETIIESRPSYGTALIYANYIRKLQGEKR